MLSFGGYCSLTHTEKCADCGIWCCVACLLQIPRFVKDEDDRAKLAHVLQPAYRYLRVVFKRIAGLTGCGDPFSINWNAFTEFMQVCNVVDHDRCQLKVRPQCCVTHTKRIGAASR